MAVQVRIADLVVMRGSIRSADLLIMRYWAMARVGPRPGYRLLVHWREGGLSLIDFSKDIASGPVWAPLRDEHLFNKVRVVNYDRVSE